MFSNAQESHGKSEENKGDSISYLLKTSATPLTPLIASQRQPGKPATQRTYEEGSARSAPSWQRKVTTTCDHVTSLLAAFVHLAR